MTKNIAKGENYRITVLTDRLIRLEYQKEGFFEDRATKMVVSRDFPEAWADINDCEDSLVIETKSLVLKYDKREFSPLGLSITLKDSNSLWNYGMGVGNADGNLMGTARTLDGADGEIDLEGGIFGRKGFAVIDDSYSPVCEALADGAESFINRERECVDIYFFGYGTDFFGGLKDFYRLCGKTPMIPRYALGNWWSRYYEYTEESYNEVMDNFEKEEIPLSVAVIDMDWHITKVDPKYGSGWTGFSWNREFFPDPERFLKNLHKRGLHTTLNLHPADGVRAFEDMYKQVADRMGVDASKEEPVEFDFGNSDFRDTYFEELMHPYEKMGVDFWWIDWQQGTGKHADDVDPLFLLNHYHYKDQEGRNVRPMIFSRYAGPGSHRYPIGFSGDTKMTWKSLSFQPYFTSTASNIGYGWWSHDIGGHMMGSKDLERLVRWVEQGVFSPIMRLHSSNSPFLNKEPWVLGEPYHKIIADFMRLRASLIPYLYTETYRAYKDDKPLIRPMYYELPDDDTAYNVHCEYGFGEQLIVGAITGKLDAELKMAPVNMIIPKGRWYDLLNGLIYEGRSAGRLYRKLEETPVLLREGGIVPMNLNDRENGAPNPKDLKLCIGAGKEGEYTLYEDDGITMNYAEGDFVTTTYSQTYKKGANGLDCLEFTINKAEGNTDLIPKERGYELHIYGVDFDEVNGRVIASDSSSNGLDAEAKYIEDKKVLVIKTAKARTESGASITVSGLSLAENDKKKRVFDILEYAWTDIMTKDAVYNALRQLSDDEFIKWLSEADVSENLKDAINEIYSL